MSKTLWKKALVSAYPLMDDIENNLSDELHDALARGDLYANVMKSTDEKSIVVQLTDVTFGSDFTLILQDDKVYFDRNQLKGYFDKNQLKGVTDNSKACFFCLVLAFNVKKNQPDAIGVEIGDLLSLNDCNDKIVPWIPFNKELVNSLVGDLQFYRSYSKKISKNIIGQIQGFSCDGQQGYCVDDDVENFVIRTEDSYNDLEVDRIKNNALVDGFLPMPEDNACIKRIYNWVNKKGYAPSFFFYGPAGTGKSEVGKYFSKITGIPYTFVTCSAMTNEADLRGKPNKLSQNGAIIKFANRLIDNFWKRKIETSDIDSDEISYSDTELVLACKYGWIIEVQEAAHIIDAGTLGFLNCTLDTNRVLTLPNGTQMKIHPNTTFIFTSNVEYEGCNPFNLSLLSRMCYTRRFDKMPFNAQVERVMSVTNYNVREDVVKVVRAVNELNNIIVDNDITQGICDLRSAINCITDYQMCGDSLRQSAKLTIEDKVSLESGYEEEIRLKLDSILGLI